MVAILVDFGVWVALALLAVSVIVIRRQYQNGSFNKCRGRDNEDETPDAISMVAV